MRIDLPGCNLKECRYCFDHNCTDKNRHNSCNYAMLNELDIKGLLFRLPVAIGSDVYFIPSKVNYDLNVLSRHEENNRVYHQKVANIVFNKRGWYLECDKNLEYGVDHILVDVFYKETWFTSEEEAEQTLAKMQGK